jgi:hypothetical protein
MLLFANEGLRRQQTGTDMKLYVELGPRRLLNATYRLKKITEAPALPQRGKDQPSIE